MNSNIKKVLILRLSALGDSIHTLPLAYAIKKTYPNCEIGWVVEDKAQQFIKDNPLVDKCYVIPKKDWIKHRFNLIYIYKSFRDIINEINAQNYDVVLDVQQLFKSACLLPFLNIKRKITLSGGREFSSFFSNEIYEQSHCLFDPDYHIVLRNLEFAKHIGADTSDVKFVLSEPSVDVKEKISLLLSETDVKKPTVVFAPATTWDNKHWKEEFWGIALTFLKGKANIVFTGTDSDITLIKRILTHSDSLESDVTILAGKTNLSELAELFRRVDLVISPDSGSVHLAWAVSKPAIISLFTATAENRTAPFGENCYVLAPKLDCRPCSKRKCRLTKQANLCCELVKPQQLIDLICQVLHFE